MRILIPTSSYPLKAYPSWAPFIKEMATAAADKDHQVFVLVFAPENKRQEYIESENPNVKVIAYNYLCIGKPMLHSSVGLLPSLKNSLLARLQFPLYIFSSAIKIFQTSKRYKIDIIHAQWYIPMGFIAGLLKPVLKKPLVITGLGADFHLKNNFITRFLLRFTSKSADLNIACSNYLLNKAGEYGLDTSSFELIPNLVDFAKFRPRQRDLNKKVRIGCAKRLVPEKNLQDLVLAVSELAQEIKKKIEVRILGEGPARESLERLISSLHLQDRVKLLGGVSHNQVPDFLKDLDIYVDTSTQEGIAASNLEAMASGCAIVATDGYGNRDIIRHERNGLLYKAREIKQLSQILKELINDPFKRKKISSLARNSVEDKFAAAFVAARLKKLYLKLKHSPVLFIQHSCQSGLDVWLRNLSRGLKNQGLGHQILWLNHLAEPIPALFTKGVKESSAIIHTMPLLGSNLRKKCKRLVLTILSFYYDKEKYIIPNPVKRIYWNIIKRRDLAGLKAADAIVCVSYFLQKRLSALFGLNARVIYPGIDTEIFKPGPFNRDFSGKEKIKLFFAGNLSHIKGFDLLMGLARILGSSAQIRVACGLKAAKKTHFAKEGNIIFLGSLDFNSPELVSEYQNCDLFVATSRLEGFGINLAEAMACGKPLVALNAGPTREIIDEGQGGYVIDNFNLKEMAEKIHYLHLHPQLREKMGAYNRRKAEARFSLKRLAQEYSDLLSQQP